MSDNTNKGELLQKIEQLTAERDALAATVESLHEKLGKALDLAETGAANNWHVEGDDVAWIDEQLKEHAKGATTPQQHLRDVLAEAVINFAKYIDDTGELNFGDSNFVLGEAGQYAENLKGGKL